MTIKQRSGRRTPLPSESVAADLRERVDGEIRFDPGSRAAYSTDGSNYRQVPIGVVVPTTPEAAANAVAVCRDHGVPVLSRGGGTSLAGQCCNAAVVIDWSKYCTRVSSVDTDAGTAVVEPGIKLDVLNDSLRPSGWMVGPRPSTHVSCTIGGMIGNNSCGSTAQAYGKMVDSVRRMEVLTYDGSQMWVGPTGDDEFARIVARGGRRADLYRGLKAIVDEYAHDIRSRYPHIPRRVSGYNLDSLLPEQNFQLAQALVGSESTLVTVLRAEVALVRIPAASAMALLGFDDIAAAADAVPAVLEHRPAALEGLDHRLVELEHSQRLAEKALRRLPDGNAWLIVQMDGDSQGDADHKAKSMIEALHTVAKMDATVLDDPTRKKEVWAAREAGLGATAYPPTGAETHEGWEDAAVPPDRLGDYLRVFRRLLDRYDYGTASLYGHFGQGCVHTRIPFDLRTAEGIANYRHFVEDAAHLVVDYGGSLSGEHGDGQSRGELLPIMFGERVVRAFEKTKTLFDPRQPDEPRQGREPVSIGRKPAPGRELPPPGAAHPLQLSRRRAPVLARCGAVRRRRQVPRRRIGCDVPELPGHRRGGALHPRAGRRLLFEMLQGDVITDGWRSTDVRDALDLCLACKGCRSDCPVNVDMATYKAEFLSHHYRRRLRPDGALLDGMDSAVGAAGGDACPARSTRVTHAQGLATAVKGPVASTGTASCPCFADERFTRWFRSRPPHARAAPQRHGGAVARHLHQQLRTQHRQRRRDGPGIGRLRRRGAHACRLLRADLDIDRPARHRQTRSAPHASDAAAGVAGRHAGGGARTQLRGGIPVGHARTAARRRRRAPVGQADQHPG